MKTCIDCKETKHLEQFNKNKSKNDGYQDRCRACDNTRAKTYYAANKARMVKQIGERNKRNILVVKQWLCEYLTTHSCVDCGVSDIVVLEFDHLYDKEQNVSTMCLQGWSIPRIEQEIAKCEVVCANCHRRRTAKRGGHYRHKYSPVV